MKAEKRSVHTDALETLGNIIDETAKRDAIHLAVEPVIAGEILAPGDDIGIKDGMARRNTKPRLGIVDPFIKGFVEKGQKFWLIVYPRTITSLRHVWEHPEFDKKQPELPLLNPDFSEGIVKEEKHLTTSIYDNAKKWLEDYAEQMGILYITLMEAADDYVKHGYHMSLGESEEYVPDEFWDHYEKVKGITVSDNERGSFFSCSC